MDGLGRGRDAQIGHPAPELAVDTAFADPGGDEPYQGDSVELAEGCAQRLPVIREYAQAVRVRRGRDGVEDVADAAIDLPGGAVRLLPSWSAVMRDLVVPVWST